MGEHTFFATFFIFFSSRTEKCYSFSQTFFGSLRRFLHSLHSTSVASGRYVWSVGLLRPPLRPPLKGTPAFAPDSTALPLQTPRPFTPFVPFHSFRKVVRDPKKSFENKRFFCSLVLKKKSQQELLVFFCSLFPRIHQAHTNHNWIL